VEFAGEEPHIGGAEATLRDVYLFGGSKVELGRMRLRGREDGLFLRVAEGARRRPLELRIAGRGKGGLLVAEGGFWNPVPRERSYPVAGPFLVRHPYTYVESGGPDIRIAGAAGAAVEIEWIALVGPGDPVRTIPSP